MKRLVTLSATVLATAFATVLALALPAAAQDQATLVSDSLSITGDTRLIAEGNVEVFFKKAFCQYRYCNFRFQGCGTAKGSYSCIFNHEIGIGGRYTRKFSKQK